MSAPTEPTQCTYHAFYKGKKIELQAETSCDAQRKAAQMFNAKKYWQVNVILVAKGDNPIVHIAVD